MKHFILVRLDYNYCDYLRQFDNKVPYNKNKKELRPFIGILFQINNCHYKVSGKIFTFNISKLSSSFFIE